MQLNTAPLKFDAQQIEAIIDKVVPLVASPADQDFFRAVLHLKAESSTSAQFSAFIANLLKTHAAQPAKES